MKKEVTYYLEDTSRLSEISQAELESWIGEMPFHQPLQILASIKSEMENHGPGNSNKVYSAYFAEDFELIKNGRSKSKNQRNKNTKQLATTIDIQPESESKNKKKSGKEKSKKKLPEIVHNLADDALEDQVKIEVAEDFTKIETISEVSSELANDLLEDEVISEVMEENISIVAPIVSHEKQDINKSELDQVVAVEDNDIGEAVDKIEENIADNVEILEDDKKKLVDYSEYSNIASDSRFIQEDDSTISDYIAQEEKPIDVDLEENTFAKEKLDDKSTFSKSDKRKEKDKSKKKKKEKIKREEKKKKSKKKEKKRKKKKSNKETKTKKSKSDNPDKSKKEKKKKRKAKNEVKRIEGKAKKKKRKKKDKTDKENQDVKYIIVDSSKNEDFKLNDYDGVSSYTSWLLEQESVNGDKTGKTSQAKMKKEKKKKKKKKSKSLKIAVDSIKKQDSIISEPLANILAMQGHKKKARKMYAKLAFVFPEKKAYFEEKIEALKK